MARRGKRDLTGSNALRSVTVIRLMGACASISRGALWHVLTARENGALQGGVTLLYSDASCQCVKRGGPGEARCGLSAEVGMSVPTFRRRVAVFVLTQELKVVLMCTNPQLCAIRLWPMWA